MESWAPGERDPLDGAIAPLHPHARRDLGPPRALDGQGARLLARLEAEDPVGRQLVVLQGRPEHPRGHPRSVGLVEAPVEVRWLGVAEAVAPGVATEGRSESVPAPGPRHGLQHRGGAGIDRAPVVGGGAELGHGARRRCPAGGREGGVAVERPGTADLEAVEGEEGQGDARAPLAVDLGEQVASDPLGEPLVEHRVGHLVGGDEALEPLVPELVGGGLVLGQERQAGEREPGAGGQEEGGVLHSGAALGAPGGRDDGQVPIGVLAEVGAVVAKPPAGDLQVALGGATVARRVEHPDGHLALPTGELFEPGRGDESGVVDPGLLEADHSPTPLGALAGDRAGGPDAPTLGDVHDQRVAGEVGVEFAVAVIGEAGPGAVGLELRQLGKELRDDVEVPAVPGAGEERREASGEGGLDRQGLAGLQRLGQGHAELGAVVLDELVVGLVQPVLAVDSERGELDGALAPGAHRSELAAALLHENGPFVLEGVHVEVEEQVPERALGGVLELDADGALHRVRVRIEGGDDLVGVRRRLVGELGGGRGGGQRREGSDGPEQRAQQDGERGPVAHGGAGAIAADG